MLALCALLAFSAHPARAADCESLRSRFADTEGTTPGPDAGAASVGPADLLTVRQGQGLRLVCEPVDGVNQLVEYPVTLEDLWVVETGEQRVLISAWEHDSGRRQVRSVRLELDLSPAVQEASTGVPERRRANAAACPQTVTGRCSSASERHTRVQAVGGGFQVEQLTTHQGMASEWLLWLLRP